MTANDGERRSTTTTKMPLIIWDIDGTLTSLVPEPIDFFKRHLTTLPIALTNNPDAFTTHGKTERQIVESLLESNLGGPPSDNLLTCALRLLQMNSDQMRMELVSTITSLPGIARALHWIRSLLIPSTVVTGNSFHAACGKLAAAGLADFLSLPCGGYADDGADKSELILAAIERCEEWHNCHIPRSSVVYVGDTPYDVEAAHLARVSSIAVATGQFTLAELRRVNPVASLRNLALDANGFRYAIERLYTSIT